MANTKTCFIKSNVVITTASGWLQRLVRWLGNYRAPAAILQTKNLCNARHKTGDGTEDVLLDRHVDGDDYPNLSSGVFDPSDAILVVVDELTHGRGLCFVRRDESKIDISRDTELITQGIVLQQELRVLKCSLEQR